MLDIIGMPDSAAFSNMVSKSQNYPLLSNLYDTRKSVVQPEVQSKIVPFDHILQAAFSKLVNDGGTYNRDEIPELFEANFNTIYKEMDNIMHHYSNSAVWGPDLPLPEEKPIVGIAVVNKKMYTISENEGVREYDLMTGKWTNKSFMPFPRAEFGIEVVNDKIYVMGGRSLEKGLLNTVEEYDPQTDTWTTKNPMPTGRTFFGTMAMNNKIYLIGGWEGEETMVTATRRVDEYNPATDTWTTKNPVPIGSEIEEIMRVGNEIWISGRTERPASTWDGVRKISLNSITYTPSPPAQKYDPSTNSWRLGWDIEKEFPEIASLIKQGKIERFSDPLQPCSSLMNNAFTVVYASSPEPEERQRDLETKRTQELSTQEIAKPGDMSEIPPEMKAKLEEKRRREFLTDEINKLVADEREKINSRQILLPFQTPFGPEYSMSFGRGWSGTISRRVRAEVMEREDLTSDIKANEEEIRRTIRLSIMDSLIIQGGAAGKPDNLPGIIPGEEKKYPSAQPVEKSTVTPVETITPGQAISSEVKMPAEKEKLYPGNEEEITPLEKGLSELMTQYVTQFSTYTNMQTTQILMDIPAGFDRKG